ncbi:MAG: asparagine synthase (glutamine-hydrolyzing) [Clostridia bacterium]|nr:asparagine synthase (glutamine-hydrolyzing) [Clostridia bacterium]
MCGFVGFVNMKKNISSKNNIYSMNEALKKRGPDEDGYYYEEHVCLGHKRLIVVDPDGGKQPMTTVVSNSVYTIVYNGQIYNTKELRDELIENGFDFKSYSDTEVILKGYIYWKTDLPKKLNGIFAFAIWNSEANELFLARDNFGVKPLFYTIYDNTLIFGSELKAILRYPGIEPKLDEQSIAELFGIGPARTPGSGIFKNIYEIKPANYAIFNDSGLHQNQYWKLESKPHNDSLKETTEKIRFLLESSINRQLYSDVPLCVFLSGGLDSSIIAHYASKYFQKNNLGKLNTFSVDYIDNDINFQKTDFQPNSDKHYIELMSKTLNTNHHTIMLDTPDLVASLEDAMIARDFPGMADVDSSLLMFCKNVKKFATVSLTGECADEIFGGYPWFFREDSLSSGTFPWSIAITERQKLLNPRISDKIHLKDYIDYRYNETLKEVEILDEDSMETAQKRKISYLTLNWFMQTLLDRSDRMAMYNGFEIRVPFCDYKLAEYVWNIPWEMKALHGREKGLLRHAMKGILPDEIIERKKSPYPKTWNPTYLNAVKEKLTSIMNNQSSPIKTLLNKDYIGEILETNGTAFTRPWFGQLMTGPQLMAYLCQVNMWLEKYQPKIEL